MEEDSKDIQRLIKIKRQRPSFSRMISWEMSQAENSKVSARSKQKKKQKSGDGTSQECTETEGAELETDKAYDSAGSSDYETANEELEDELDHSDAFISVDSLCINDLDEEDTSNDSDEYNIEDEEDTETSLIESVKGTLEPARRRRPSKRQKRNRRRMFQVTYGNDLSNLGNLFDMTSEIDDALQEADDALLNIEVQCPVPTLVELCLLSMKKGRKRQKSGSTVNKPSPVMPYRIKKLISNWNFQQKMFEKQLSFLQNYVLPSVCEKDGVKKASIYYHCDTPCRLQHPVRSVWTNEAYPVSDQGQEAYQSEKAAAFLYHPGMRSHDPENSYSYSDSEYLERLNPSSIHVQSALATTIDLMMPYSVGERGVPKSCSTETDVMSKAIKTMIIRVKIALKLRYPHLIDQLFDRVMPYVMWARGNIGLATSLFQSLLQKEDCPIYKAMYLSEIAVMHLMFCESQTAESFYKLAAEMTLTDENRDKAIKEVTEERQVLLASISDCGTFDSEKCYRAVHYWTSAVHLPKPAPTTVTAAVDSYLGLHLAHITDEDYWREAETRLSSWVSSYKYLNYHLALLCALQGKVDSCTTAFREFKGFCGLYLPGHDILEYLDKKDRKNPMSPLINIIKGQRYKVKPMKVVWRTQFRPPRLTNDSPIEADLTSPDLNLCINEDGLLTGDMQMLMPPIRQINLDLLTGAVVLNTVPSSTGTWQTVIENNNQHLMVDLMLPTPQQIYCNDDGTMVHLISPNLDPCHMVTHDMAAHLPTCPKILTWRNASGQTSRLNLITITKKICRKAMLDTDFTVSPFNSYSFLKMNILRHLMEVAYTKNLSMNIKDIQSCTTRIWNNRSSLRNKSYMHKKGKGSSNEDDSHLNPAKLYSPKILPNMIKHYTVDIQGKPFQFGKCVVVSLRLHSAQHLFYLMFIDTRSRESFQKHKMERVGFSKPQIPNQARVGSTITDSKFFMYLTNSGYNLNIHNDSGENVDTIDLNKEQRGDGFNNLCIVGDYLFGVSKCQLNVWRHLIGSQFDLQEFYANTVNCLSIYWELPDEKKVIEDLVVLGTEVHGKGHFLMLHMSMGLGFMDPDTLEMIPISKQSKCDIQLTEDGKVLLVKVKQVLALAQKSFMDDNKAVTLFTVSLANKVLLFKVCHEEGSQQLKATLMSSLILPGKAVEVCILGKSVGLLVSLTQHDKKDKNYREHVFYFACDGTLLQVLLCLGKGPRSFCPVYMKGPENAAEKSGWYVYMRDGKDGIICTQITRTHT